MPYIGKQLVRGQNRKLDDISSGFNGSQTTFTLQVASQNVTVGSALQLWISLGGVIQDPLSDYTIAGNQITFTTAPAASLDFFGVIQGDVTDTNTPGDATVTTSKLSTGLTVNLADGSAATSSLQLGGTDSGLFSSAADKVNVTTGGVERLEIGDSEVVFNDPSNDVNFRVESNGNTHMLFVDGGNDRVGIGTSSPDELLHVANTGGGASILIETNASSGGNLLFGDNSSNTVGRVQYDHSGNSMRLHTNGSERLRIDSSGQVGIGTTSPVTDLELSRTGNNADGLTLTCSDHTNTPRLFFKSTSTNGAPVLFGEDGDLRINTGGTPGSSSGTERMRIDSSGRVLVGTTTEGHVSADNFTVADSGHCGITIRSGTTSEGAIYFSDGTSGDAEYRGQVLYDHDGDYMRFSTAVTERLRITSTGRMGLGITSPQQRQHIHEGSSAASVTQYTNSVTGSTANDGLLVGLDSTEDGLFWIKESQNLTFGTANTERMRVDSSGRLLVGTSTAPSNGSFATTAKLVSQGNTTESIGGAVLSLQRGEAATAITTGEYLGNICFSDNTGKEFARIDGLADGTAGGVNGNPGRLVFRTEESGSDSGPKERFRIAAAGWVQFYPTATVDAVNIAHPGTAGSTYRYIYGAANGTNTFTVFNNGNVQNTNNSYGAISDIKLKENIVDAGSQWDDLKTIQVRNYNFKAETGQPTHTQLGVVAQEVELVSPGLVSESPDRDDDGNDLGTVTKSVNYSVLYMKAVKALQEAMDRIETLEAKVAALEAE